MEKIKDLLDEVEWDLAGNELSVINLERADRLLREAESLATKMGYDMSKINEVKEERERLEKRYRKYGLLRDENDRYIIYLIQNS